MSLTGSKSGSPWLHVPSAFRFATCAPVFGSTQTGSIKRFTRSGTAAAKIACLSDIDDELSIMNKRSIFETRMGPPSPQISSGASRGASETEMVASTPFGAELSLPSPLASASPAPRNGVRPPQAANAAMLSAVRVERKREARCNWLYILSGPCWTWTKKAAARFCHLRGLSHPCNPCDRSAVKKPLRALVFLVAALAALLLWNTYRRGPLPRAIGVAPPAGERLDEQAIAEHLAAAVRFRTVSHQYPKDDDPAIFAAFREFLESTYPKVHATMKRELVNENGLLYRWEGSDRSLSPVLFMAHQDVVPVEPGTE